MAKKSAVFKDTNTNRETLTLTQNADNSISLEVNNIKGVLRLIANQLNFNYDAEWTTQQFGRELIKQISGDESAKRAEFKDKEETNAKITLIRNDDSSIELEVNNDKGLMRLIAKALNFAYDESWNTQTLGSKLIDAINNPTTNTAQSETAEQEADSTAKFFRWYEVFGSYEKYQEAVENGTVEDEDEFSGLSDGAWEWWKKLPINLKALILERYRSLIEDEDLPLYKGDEDEGLWRDDEDDEVEDENLWFEDKNTFISFLLTDYICELDGISFTLAEEYGHSITSDDMAKLAYLPNLKHIEFYKTDGYGLPFDLMDLPYINELNYSRTDLDSDSWAALLGFAKTHPQMKMLDISSTPMEDFLAEEPEKVAVLRALMPNCKIESLNSLSEEKADAKTVEKHLNTEAVLWWKNADDFSRYVCFCNMEGVVFGRYRKKLPIFDESNGFKIVSSELNLDDVWAENGFIWREVNKLFEKEEELTINLNFENPFASWDETSFINKEAYDYSYLNKMFKSVRIYATDKPFPVQFSKTKGIKEISLFNMPERELPDIKGFDELELIKFSFSYSYIDEKGLFPIEEFAKLSKLPNLKTFKLGYDYEEYEDVIKEYFPDTVSIVFGY